MDLISLELNRAGKSDDDAASTAHFTNQIQMLIRGIALHSMESQPEDFSNLQRHMANIAASVLPDSPSGDLPKTIALVLSALEDYNRNASSIFDSQRQELRAMIADTSDTLQFLVSSSETSVKQLSFVESQLQRARGLDDLRQLKIYTAACLSLVRRESSRLQTETAEKVAALKSDLERLSARLKTAAVKQSQDLVTGLPARAAAEQAIENGIAAGKPCVAALFVLDGMPSVNGTFGREVGDSMLLSCAQMLAKQLNGATLYRWSGPAFVALFDALVAPLEAESRARQAAAQQIEKTVAAGERMLRAVVRISCRVQSITGRTSAVQLFRALDQPVIAEPKVVVPQVEG